MLDEAVYGLPEIGHRDAIREADLVAGPGCNSTAALLGLWPLREHLADAVVDIKTGVSGSGREATEETHYVSAADNVNPYKTEGHRHSAELEQEIPGVDFTFVPHLIPVDQGLMATNYAITKSDLTKDEVRSLLHDAYADEPFVDVVDEPPHTSHVRGTNRARVYGTVTGSRVLTVCAIDNLWKGAAGQAVQDLNLMLGLAGDGGVGMTFFASQVGRAARAREGAGANRASGGLRERRLRGRHQAGGAGRGADPLPARPHGLRRALHHQRAGGRAGGGVPGVGAVAGCGR